MFRKGHAFPRDRSPNSLRTKRGLLQLMTHRPIAIDGAGADDSGEGGAGNVKPDPSNVHGGDGACIDQVGRSNGPSSTERPRQRCGSLPCSERAPASQAPQIPALGVETFHGVHNNIYHIYIYTYYVSGTYARSFPISVLFPCVLVLSGCFLRYSSNPDLLKPVLQ